MSVAYIPPMRWDMHNGVATINKLFTIVKTNMTLSELDILEKEIFVRLGELNSQRPDSETLNNFLWNAYRKYTFIHKAYIDLIRNGDDSTKEKH